MNTTTNLIKQFNLPSYIKGKSFSDAAKAIENKFKDRHDKYANDTKEELMQRLAKAQEYVKMQDSLKNESQQVPDQMNGQIPKGMKDYIQQGQPQNISQQEQSQEYAYGGPTDPPTATQPLDSLPKIGRQLINPQTRSLRNVLFNDITGNRSLTKDSKGNFFLIPHGDLQYDPTGWRYNGKTEQPMTSAQAAYFMRNTELPQPQPEANVDSLSTPKKSFAYGGDMATEDVLNTASGLFDSANQIFGNPGIDTSGRQLLDAKAAKREQLGQGISSGVDLIKGIGTGNPLDIIKGVGGVGSAIFGGNKKIDAINKANKNYAQAQNAQYRQSDFAFGGLFDKIVDNQRPTSITKEGINIPSLREGIDSVYKNQLIGTPTASTNFDKSILDKNLSVKDDRTNAGKALDWLGKHVGKNAGEIASYAPVLGNVLGLKNLKQGTTERGARMNSKYKPQPYDINRLQNILNQHNTERALTESSGGNLGALRANLQAAGLNKLKAQSNALANANTQNIAENKYAFQTQMQNDKANVALEQDFINRKAADKGAYESAKAGLQRQLGQDIGNIGREESNKKLIKEMLGYKWNGKYYIDAKGNIKTTKEANEELAKKQKG